MERRTKRLWFWSCFAQLAGSAGGQAPGRLLLAAALAMLWSDAGLALPPDPLREVQADGQAVLPPPNIGWRTDGTGSYPKAQPPLEWSTTKNVVWSTLMPGYGVGHPVPLGRRVFTGSEPATLLCVDRDDGTILWQKTCSYSELDIEPAVRERLKEELVEVAELNKKQSAIQREMDTLHRSLVKDKAPREEVDRKLKPFRKEIDDLNKQKLKFVASYGL
jgi:hypothetical protein